MVCLGMFSAGTVVVVVVVVVFPLLTMWWWLLFCCVPPDHIRFCVLGQLWSPWRVKMNVFNAATIAATNAAINDMFPSGRRGTAVRLDTSAAACDGAVSTLGLHFSEQPSRTTTSLTDSVSSAVCGVPGASEPMSSESASWTTGRTWTKLDVELDVRDLDVELATRPFFSSTQRG